MIEAGNEEPIPDIPNVTRDERPPRRIGSILFTMAVTGWAVVGIWQLYESLDFWGGLSSGDRWLRSTEVALSFALAFVGLHIVLRGRREWSDLSFSLLFLGSILLRVFSR